MTELALKEQLSNAVKDAIPPVNTMIPVARNWATRSERKW